MPRGEAENTLGGYHVKRPAAIRRVPSPRGADNPQGVFRGSRGIPGVGLDPTWPEGHGVLSAARLTSSAPRAGRADGTRRRGSARLRHGARAAGAVVGSALDLDVPGLAEA